MAWIGLAVAASTLVGRAIGAGDVRVARRFAALTAAVGAALSIGLGLVLGLARSPIAALFTTDAAVNALTAALLPLLGGILLVDGSTNVLTRTGVVPGVVRSLAEDATVPLQKRANSGAGERGFSKGAAPV